MWRIGIPTKIVLGIEQDCARGRMDRSAHAGVNIPAAAAVAARGRWIGFTISAPT
jgi:hypothetical protein